MYIIGREKESAVNSKCVQCKSLKENGAVTARLNDSGQKQPDINILKDYLQ